MKKYLFPSLLIVLFFSCGHDHDHKSDGANQSDSSDTDTALFSDMETLSDHYTIHASSSIINSLSNSIHSPLEFTEDLINSGAEYSAEVPAKLLNGKYEPIELQAIIAGICAADLCYIYQYNQKPSASDYYHKFLEFSKNLGFFDYLDGGLIAKLNQNSGDSQALSKIIRDEFGSLHKKLDSEGKGEISTLILIGSWIESTHVYLETYEQNHNTKIHDIIGAQKIVLNKLIILLSNYSSNNGYLFEFKEKLNILLDKFSGVKIAYTHDTLLEANSKEEFLNIEDKTRTVTVSDEELQEIRISLEELRNNLIKN